MNQPTQRQPRPWGIVLAGLAVLLGYWFAVHPAGFARGYTQDWCQPELTRQLMAQTLDAHGGPYFQTRAFMAPGGMSDAFMPWGIEISWLGAYFWKLGRDIPFIWLHYGMSLVLSYLGVGWILRRMRLAPRAAWGLALGAVLLNVSRHFKTWHHYEHQPQHWVYLSLFLDAWIWQRFCRERRWSWSLEAWRGLCLLGMLTTAGYFWGPLILEWALVRLCMGALALIRRARGSLPVVVEGSMRQALPALALGTCLAGLELRWFVPLYREVKALGPLVQKLDYFGRWPYIVRPLWLDDAVSVLRAVTGREWVRRPFNSFETVITPGWFLLIPALVGLARVEAVRRRASGLVVAAPFLLLFVIGVIYATQDPPRLAPMIQAVVPFMSYFRVAARWGLFFPAILGVIIALSWPELSAWVRAAWSARMRGAIAFFALFCVSSLAEVAVLRAPVSSTGALPESATHLLEDVRRAPGETVLDLPFCHAGGNGVCSAEQCPNYPESTTGACLRGWHDKSVYGIYASRLVEEQCAPYHQAPYLAWFDAWSKQRCWDEAEWSQFCAYLDGHPELSAILLYPDIWKGAGRPECLAEFTRHLGAPLEQARLDSQGARIMRFGTTCQKK
jgi:hypothetical protein